METILREIFSFQTNESISFKQIAIQWKFRAFKVLPYIFHVDLEIWANQASCFQKQPPLIYENICDIPTKSKQNHALQISIHVICAQKMITQVQDEYKSIFIYAVSSSVQKYIPHTHSLKITRSHIIYWTFGKYLSLQTRRWSWWHTHAFSLSLSLFSFATQWRARASIKEEKAVGAQ